MLSSLWSHQWECGSDGRAQRLRWQRLPDEPSRTPSVICSPARKAIYSAPRSFAPSPRTWLDDHSRRCARLHPVRHALKGIGRCLGSGSLFMRSWSRGPHDPGPNRCLMATVETSARLDRKLQLCPAQRNSLLQHPIPREAATRHFGQPLSLGLDLWNWTVKSAWSCSRPIEWAGLPIPLTLAHAFCQ